jgi:Mn2+/Fe2+ NRAMP family transporter
VFLGALVAVFPGNLVQLLVQAQVLNGIITPVLLGYVLVLANRTSVLGEAANGRAFRVVATVTVVIAAALSLVVLGETVGGWVGL